MKLPSSIGSVIEIVNEPNYSFGSVDNQRQYPAEFLLGNVSQPTSTHGVLLDGSPTAVFGAGGGCSAVHDHSALIKDSRLYLAVGDHLVCLCISPLEIIWATRVDTATCFGIHYDSTHDALISHGELEIARVSDAGKLIWSTSGADIFTESFSLKTECVEATDFNGHRYCLSYVTGTEDRQCIPADPPASPLLWRPGG